MRTGACISPHVWRWAERTRIDGAEIDPRRLRGGRRAASPRRSRRSSPASTPGERITQFEAAIAASFVAFADAGVDVAVIEAGLGGRLDATNVIALDARPR